PAKRNYRRHTSQTTAASPQPDRHQPAPTLKTQSAPRPSQHLETILLILRFYATSLVRVPGLRLALCRIVTLHLSAEIQAVTPIISWIKINTFSHFVQMSAI